MIAIAGAKGGCGKTMTTLGLADAFARAGTPSLAIDADRQVPSLHVLGGVDSEPSLTAFDPGTDINEITQQSPREHNSGIIAAPSAADTVDIETTLRQIDSLSMQVLVDCPPGAGQDVSDPLAAADSVVVVTTDTAGGIESAQTTIELARRLDVPVAGIILNRCTAPSVEVRSAFSTPILATVPERSSPLTDPGVRAAYNAAGAKLRGKQDRDESRGQHGHRRISTGVPAVDRTLGGGLVPGTIVAFSGPASRAERLLGELPTQRDALYLTSERSTPDIKRALGPRDSGTTRVFELADEEDPVTQATRAVAELSDETTLVVDAVDAIEAGNRAAYLDFLNQLATAVNGTRRVAVLRCLEQGPGSSNRATTRRFADTVLEL